MKTDINPKEQDPWQEEMTHLCENNPGGRVIQTEPTGRVRASSGSADRSRKWTPEHLRQQEEHARPEEPGTEASRNRRNRGGWGYGNKETRDVRCGQGVKWGTIAQNSMDVSDFWIK